jgi:molybdopterin molybdotransferase
MLSVAEAHGIVLRQTKRLPPENTPLFASALGRVLATDVAADLDSPPFTKSMMDGYAVRSADAIPGADLRVVEEVPAGAMPNRAVGPGEAVRLFTGAPVPDGADAVVMQEKTEPLNGGRVRIADPAVSPGRNVLARGKEMTVGEVVIATGTVLSPAAIGLLAVVGKTSVSAYPAPRVNVLATGNELVEPNARPGPGQIRNSNGPMLVAQAARAGATPRNLGIARDETAHLAAMIREGLATADVLLLAGGVSVGAFDLVPRALADEGVKSHFHHVRMKPGKPLFFGSRDDTLVFGLPGNPVSSFIGFELFVRPALRVLAGHPDPGPRSVTLPLTEPLTANHDRPTYHPAQLEDRRVRPLPWFGSPDLRGILTADALLVLPPGPVKYDAGSPAEVVLL